MFQVVQVYLWQSQLQHPFIHQDYSVWFHSNTLKLLLWPLKQNNFYLYIYLLLAQHQSKISFYNYGSQRNSTIPTMNRAAIHPLQAYKDIGELKEF